MQIIPRLSRLFAASTLLMASASMAATVTHAVQDGGLFSDMSLNLQVAPVGLAFLNATGSELIGLDGVRIDSTLNERLKYTSLAIKNLALRSFSYDDVSGQLIQADLKGRLFIETLRDGFPEDQGTLHIQNLRIDFANQSILADVEGSAWMTPTVDAKDLPLWRIDGASGSFDGGSSLQLQVPTLAFTAQGFDALARSIADRPDHQDALRKVDSFGSISLVPEPGISSLMLAGLMGLLAVARKARQAD